MEDKILKQWIVDGKLVGIPSKLSKRAILFKYIAKNELKKDIIYSEKDIIYSEKDIIYSEKDINEIIKKYHSDFTTIRRYWVDNKILSRTPDGAIYKYNGVCDEE